jgi:hypothetical protein
MRLHGGFSEYLYMDRVLKQDDFMSNIADATLSNIVMLPKSP